MRWFCQPMSHSQLLNKPSINLLSSELRYPKYSKFQRLKLSVTGDTANRLGFNPLQRFVHFTRKIRPLSFHSRTSGCLRTRWPKHGLPKSSSDHCPVPIRPTVVLHLLVPSQPESQLRSTKPEPIVTCGCTGKLPGMKYSSVSLSLGEAFRKMSWRFSMHPGQPLVSPGCPSTVLHPVVCIEFLSWVLKSWGLEDEVLADSIMELSSLT